MCFWVDAVVELWSPQAGNIVIKDKFNFAKKGFLFILDILNDQ